MRHQLANKKLGRRVPHRRSLFRNQIISLMTHNKIITTEAKAKETRRIAEKLITIARQVSEDKSKNMHLKNLAFTILNDKKMVEKLFNEIAPQYKERDGGYTRIYKLGRRAGDAAEMAMLEFVK
ncbi:MAG: 50S ribosomal protein L17 [Candidatus Wallbacteria bacterium GWC2_49_35]|uniref:Large ribosomal subunit protein bL17 n=1 Tax=Candidatus Wallbacteria bacterium GWC2_49_35 TaxID=1817813 RepID=A0A1F7WHN6_9BACT|nr:MAG: 50S ribosomal protein L17 [Candidatus Wallbacteria bacterium GWC2_49_35]HBC75254.1 50S ribosomal protein L17 [Candidatus Wallbacteria bacterium]